MRRSLTGFTLALFLSLGATAEAEFIVNGSFETVPSSATGQGLLPSDWFHVGSGADTYSNNGSYGLAPGAGGAFTGVTATDGIRWVAGVSAPNHGPTNTAVEGEAFGTTLDEMLLPGGTYELDAFLYQNVTAWPDHPGGYQVFLSEGTSGAGAVLLGALGTTAVGVNTWQAKTLSFVAPLDSGSRSYLIFVPYVVIYPYAGPYPNSYIGLDAVSLRSTGTPSAVPLPSSLFLAISGLGSFGLMAARLRRSPASRVETKPIS